MFAVLLWCLAGGRDEVSLLSRAVGGPRSRLPNRSPICGVAHFKTLKHCPAFPGRFGSIEDARAFCTEFSPTTTTNTGYTRAWAACRATGLPQANHYRRHRQSPLLAKAKGNARHSRGR